MVLLSYQGNKFLYRSISLHVNWGKSGANQNYLIFKTPMLSVFDLNSIHDKCHELNLLINFITGVKKRPFSPPKSF